MRSSTTSALCAYPYKQSSSRRWPKADLTWRSSGSGNTSPVKARGHSFTPALRERLRATATTLFDVELGTYEQSMPDDRALAAIAVPVLLVVSEDSHDFFAEVTRRLSGRLGADVATTPGRHGAYHDHPKELAETIRPFLREVSWS